MGNNNPIKIVELELRHAFYGGKSYRVTFDDDGKKVMMQGWVSDNLADMPEFREELIKDYLKSKMEEE